MNLLICALIKQTIKKMILKKFSVLFLLLILITTFYSCSETPDAIYVNGKIYSMDNDNKVYEAMAIKDGKIIDIGTTDQINSDYKSEDVTDLQGAVVLPGLIDSDGSIIEFSKNLNFINLSYAKSIREILDLIIEKTKTTKEGEWIGGYGWNELNIPESELVTINKEMLDEIAPNYNVYLVNATFSTVWTNSRLLRFLQVEANTPSPENGEIEKDANGNPTGLFFDNAVNIVKNNIPGLMKSEMESQVLKGLNEIAKYGITSVHDRTVGEDGIQIFRKLIDEKKFPIRVYAVLSGEDSSLINTYLSKGPEINYGERMTIRAVTLDYDGQFDLQDAYMTDEYKNEPKVKIPYVSESEIENLYTLADEKGFQFSIKAVGDKAVSTSLDIFEKINKQKDIKDNRTIIEYCEFVNPKDFSRISDLKIIPSIRPDVGIFDLQIVSQLINPENANKLGLWNSLIKSAGKITTGSDFPFHQINPFVQMYYLTTRQLSDTVLNTIANPDQKISITDAVRSYTVWPAYASFEEDTKGTLEKGKLADFIVISNDIFNSPPKELLKTTVTKTIVNGRVIYDRSKERN